MAGLRIPGVPVAALGKPNGVATLDANGHVPAAQAEPYIPESVWLPPAQADKASAVTLGSFGGLPALVIPHGQTGGLAAIRFTCRLPARWTAYSSRIWWAVADNTSGNVTLRSRFIGNGFGIQAGSALPSFVTSQDQVVTPAAPSVLTLTQSPTTRTAPAGSPVLLQWERRGVEGEGDTFNAPIYVIGVEVTKVT